MSRSCRCHPCPGRGNDGHGLTHCAECCMGTGVDAEPDCPTHGYPPYNVPPTLGPDLDDPAEEAAYLAHVEAEHADHDCDEVHGEEFEPHDCTEEEVEETTTYPTRSGRITVTGRCVVCGATRYSYPDSIL